MVLKVLHAGNLIVSAGTLVSSTTVAGVGVPSITVPEMVDRSTIIAGITVAPGVYPTIQVGFVFETFGGTVTVANVAQAPKLIVSGGIVVPGYKVAGIGVSFER